MFLTESYNDINTVPTDPTYSMELVQEATDEWNGLCMKMIKLEHSAIVSEDGNLLEAGFEDFKKKAKELAKRAFNKFMEYLERVRVEWSKIQASIATKLIRPDVISQLSGKVNNQDFNANVQAINAGNAAIKSFDKICGYGLTISDLFGEVESATKNILESRPEQTKLTSSLVNNAVSFLKNRAYAVKSIQKAKAKATKIYKEDLQRIDKKERGAEKLEITIFQRSCNKLILAINKVTSSAVAVCKGALRNVGAEARSNARKSVKGANTGKKQESTSILDMYE